MDTLAGTTIYLHGFGDGCFPSLARRRDMRRVCGPYMWTVPAAGRTEGRDYYAADEEGNPSTHDASFMLRAVARPRSFGGYRIDDGDAYMPVVLRLPRGRGFLAGWTMGKGMASSVGFTIYQDESDAWRVADREAQSAAASEAEYRAQDQEGEE